MSKTELTINIDDERFGAILNCAVRYCKGRQSYMPGLVIDFITPLLPYVSRRTLWCFERDLSDATYFGDEDIDKPLWMEFKTSVEYELQKRGEVE